MKRANRILTILIFIFLYVPMAVLIVASFNTGKDVTQFEGLYPAAVRPSVSGQDAVKAAGQLPARLGSCQLHRHGLRHGGVTGHLQPEPQTAQGCHDADQHPHDESGYRHRRVPFPAVRLRGNPDAGAAEQSDLLDAAHCPHHLQPPLRDPERHAETQADGQLPPGRGHGLGLHAPAGIFQGDAP